MNYSITEIFASLQGEGALVGSRAVFVRLAGCNHWDGDPAHRDQGSGPCAQWCDTDFAKRAIISADEIVRVMDVAWGGGRRDLERLCVLTGGEPLMQLDGILLRALHANGWFVAVETNATRANPVAAEVDHVCASPKWGTDYTKLGVVPHEVKVVLPGVVGTRAGWTDAELMRIEDWAGESAALFVQPQDPLLGEAVGLTHLHGPRCSAQHALEYSAALQGCLAFIAKRPRWRLSAQLHKYLDLR